MGLFVCVDGAGFNLHLTGGATVKSTPEVEVPSNKQRDVSLLAALMPGRRMDPQQEKY